MKTEFLTELIKNNISFQDVPRDYIGASAIGGDCWRQIWYELNGEEKNTPLNLKITWEIGKQLESMVIDLLRKAGLLLIEQISLTHMHHDFFKGTVDAIWFEDITLLKPKAIIEIKTAKDSSFSLFKKSGLKKWNRKYYAQIQAYMGMSGIYNAYILALNKDTSEFYDEFVAFNEDVYDQLCLKALAIKSSKNIPDRINNNPSWYQCKMCSYSEICHK